MAEGYLQSNVDARTFGLQQSRLLDDLNRPDLSNIVPHYLQDAMRYYSRFPFFFNDTDNSTIVAWSAATTYPQGSTIAFRSGGASYIAVASNTGVSGSTEPIWSTDIFVQPTTGFPPPGAGIGTTDDNGGPSVGIRWLTVENTTLTDHELGYWTQLSTLYKLNKYKPPFDYVAPERVEITAASLRYELEEISYSELRDFDIIRPAPSFVYPTYWAWFEEYIFIWPYPNGSYPITLSFRTAPQLARLASDTNFWTTDAEALIRAEAEGNIQQKVLKDSDAAQLAFDIARREFNALRSQTISQQSPQGIPSSGW